MIFVVHRGQLHAFRSAGAAAGDGHGAVLIVWAGAIAGVLLEDVLAVRAAVGRRAART